MRFGWVAAAAAFVMAMPANTAQIITGTLMAGQSVRLALDSQVPNNGRFLLQVNGNRVLSAEFNAYLYVVETECRPTGCEPGGDFDFPVTRDLGTGRVLSYREQPAGSVDRGAFIEYTSYLYEGITLDLKADNTSPLPTAYRVSFAAIPGAVPEPASWAMMIGGFGMAGASLRRRSRRKLQPA